MPSSKRPETSGLIGHQFEEPILFDQALSHRSWCAEQGGQPSNERLEFLGDAVLGLVVAEHTYRTYPDLPEGVMAKVRASVVNTRALAEMAGDLGLGPLLRLGKGENLSGGREKESILADTAEAVIGAIYLDGSLEAARRFILDQLAGRIEAAIAEPGESDHKSRLQEAAVRLGLGVPRYEVEGRGPDHARRYVATVYVAGDPRGTGEGRSKKDAEQEASRLACMSLEDQRGQGDA